MAGIRYKGQIFSGAASFGSADDVAYDNTGSGLTAGNVQDALDEVNTNKAGLTTHGATQASDQIYSNGDGACALQAVKGANATRLQLDPNDGDVSVYKTTDSGTTWTRLQHMRVKRAKVYDGAVSVPISSTTINFSLPSDFHMSLGAVLQRSWPTQTWDPTACVSIREDATMISTPIGQVRLSSTSTQTYGITIFLIYI